MGGPWGYKVEYEQYVSTISSFSNRSAQIGPVALLILRQFLLGPYFSTYQICNILKKMGKDYAMAYKDVHKRIKRLHSLGLIEKVRKDEIRTERESIHAPIFYRLTTGGIFNLLYRDKISMIIRARGKIFQYYGNNIIFKTLIYPYFEPSTLLKLKGIFLPEVIFSYLFRCCEITEYTLKALDKEGRSEVIIPFDWNDVPGEYYKGIVGLIANKFGVDFSEESKIEKYNNDRTIKISDKNNSIIIQLNDKKDIATLTTNDGRTYEVGVKKSDKELIISQRIGILKQAALHSLDYRTHYNILNLAFSIIMGVSEVHLVEATMLLGDREDFKILSQDPKAVDLLKETDKVFRHQYKAFVELKKRGSSSV